VRSVILRISAISGHERTLDLVLVSFIDITERRRAEAVLRANQTRLAALAELGQSPDLSVRQLCDFALEKSIELTNSEVGYLFFFDEATAEFTVYAWSEEALTQCRILDRQTTYKLANTGVWGEAVRQRRPVITNDFGASGPWKRGLPSGHVPIARHLNLPIFEQGKIVAVIGVANKIEPYDEADVQQLTLLMEGVWRLIERTHRDEALKRYNRRLSLLQELDRRILAAQSAEEIATFAVRQVRAVIPCDEALIILFDQSAGVARALAHDHVPTWADVLHEVRPLTDFALPGDDSQMLRYYPDITRLDALDPAMRNAIEKGARSVLTAPLLAGGEQFGLINLASGRADAFSTEQHEMVSEVANQIAIGLQQARLREELRQHSAELERRVKDRTQQLSEANAELDSFAYSVSHDLRAPLRALQGYSEILLEEHTKSLDDEARGFVERINGAAKRMDSLVRDVLAFSRATRFAGDLETIGLSQALKEAQLQIEAVIAENGARIEVERDLPVVRADRTVLVRAIANLLGNAVKFVAAGVIPKVRVRAQVREQSVRLWVEDNGIGIAPENQERVFAAFERLHGIEEYPGTGIGLAIVKKGIERMGGSVGVESALGDGSRFWIELPGL
jgi:signal transduction histidine kinase